MSLHCLLMLLYFGLGTAFLTCVTTHHFCKQSYLSFCHVFMYHISLSCFLPIWPDLAITTSSHSPFFTVNSFGLCVQICQLFGSCLFWFAGHILFSPSIICFLLYVYSHKLLIAIMRHMCTSVYSVCYLLAVYSSLAHHVGSLLLRDGMCFMCHCILTVIHPFLITLILYDLQLFSAGPCPTTVQRVSGLQSLLCTATGDPLCINEQLLYLFIGVLLPFHQGSIMIIIMNE